MSTFQFDQLPIESNHGNTKLLSPRNHLLESIRFRLEAFSIPYSSTEKLLDILLVYGQGFHRRLLHILQACDQQHIAQRSEIVNQILSSKQNIKSSTNKESDDELNIKYQDRTCKLALAIWTIFLQIIQHCLLSYSASGYISKKERIPETEIETIINDFLDKSKLFQIEAGQKKDKLSTVINKCKASINGILKELLETNRLNRNIVKI